MLPSQQNFWSQYIANMQIDLLNASRTKVSTEWKDVDFTPSYNRFYYVLEGEGFLKIDDDLFYPKPGELYLLPVGHVQSYGTISASTFDKYWCHFTATIGDFNVLQLVKAPIFLVMEDIQTVSRLFDQLITHYRNRQMASGLRIRAILLELLALFIEQSSPADIDTGVTASLQKMDHVIKYIEQHLSDHLTLEELAGIAHFHPNYFIKVFKETTGFSPIQYVNRIRMDKAKQMLTFTPASVSEIANAIGLEVTYFSRMFKEYNGFSPSVYRDMTFPS